LGGVAVVLQASVQPVASSVCVGERIRRCRRRATCASFAAPPLGHDHVLLWYSSRLIDLHSRRTSLTPASFCSGHTALNSDPSKPATSTRQPAPRWGFSSPTISSHSSFYTPTASDKNAVASCSPFRYQALERSDQGAGTESRQVYAAGDEHLPVIGESRFAPSL
jgi:hypothetical protein